MKNQKKGKAHSTKGDSKPSVAKRAFDLNTLENSMDFILSALDSTLKEPADKRSTKYAILHLFAGVELLLKEILQKEHWSLLFKNIDNANKDALANGSLLSVDFDALIKRLVHVCGVVIDKNALASLEALRKRRNTIQHFGMLTEDMAALKSNISEVLVFVLELIETQFDKGAIRGVARKDLLLISEKSLSFKEFVDKKLIKLKPKIERLSKICEIITCPKCFHHAFTLNDDFHCLFCKYTDSPENVANAYEANVLPVRKPDEDYYEIIEDCPECDSRALLFIGSSYLCFNCLQRFNPQDYDSCVHCSRLYHSTEDSGMLCSSCWESLINGKD